MFAVAMRLLSAGLVAAGLMILVGCGTLGHPQTMEEDGSDAAARSGVQDSKDPFEGFNRAMYTFNDKFDDWLLRPAAKGYDFIVPGPVKKGVTNFFSNLTEPMVVLNDLLQGKLLQAGSDTGRFLVNSTLGLAGLFDVAVYMKMPKHEEDFGQTLAVWGVGPGPYFVWPVIGPRDLRDSFGWLGDWFSSPVTYIEPPAASWGAYGLKLVDARALALGDKDILEQAGGADVYIFLREAYRQRRQFQVHDGNPPQIEEDLLFEDDPPAPGP